MLIAMKNQTEIWNNKKFGIVWDLNLISLRETYKFAKELNNIIYIRMRNKLKNIRND